MSREAPHAVSEDHYRRKSTTLYDDKDFFWRMLQADQAKGEPYLGFSYPEGIAYESPGLLRAEGLPRVINQTVCRANPRL